MQLKLIVPLGVFLLLSACSKEDTNGALEKFEVKGKNISIEAQMKKDAVSSKAEIKAALQVAVDQLESE